MAEELLNLPRDSATTPRPTIDYSREAGHIVSSKFGLAIEPSPANARDAARVFSLECCLGA